MAGLTIGDPVKFADVIISKNIIPGDTILLLPGTYTASTKGLSGADEAGKGVFRIKLNGRADLPITIQPLTKGTVRINGGIELVAGEASYIIVRDLEIAPTPTSREMPRADLDFPACVYCTAPGCEFHDNYLHDGSQGFEIFGTGGCKIIGNIVTNIGWNEDDGLHGTGIYTHNDPGGAITIRNNIWQAYGEHGINMWSATNNKVIDYTCQNNAVILSKLFCGCETGICENNAIVGNHVYRSPIRLGRPSLLNGLLTVTGNIAYSPYTAIEILWQRAATISGNTFINDQQPTVSYARNDASENNQVDDNIYWAGDGTNGVYSYYDEGVITWEIWASRGYDVNSIIQAGNPTTNSVHVYPLSNERTLIVIWNWQELDAVTVTLDLLPGAEVTLINGQDVTDTQVLTLDDDSQISVDMRAISHTVTAPVGGLTVKGTTFPVFGCFLIA